MSRKGALISAIAAGLALGALAGYWSGGHAGYLAPSRHTTLEEETRRLEMEYPLAASKKPYLILDLLNARLDYRLSGMTIKSLPLQIDSIREWGREGKLDRGGIMLLEIQDRGAPPEVIVPPDPNKPVDPLEDPKLFPPDPPTDFTLLFDRPVKVRFLGMKEEGWREKVQGVGRAVKGWLPWGPGGGKGEIRIQLKLPGDEAKEIYRALFRSERVVLLGLPDSPPAAPAKSSTR